MPGDWRWPKFRRKNPRNHPLGRDDGDRLSSYSDRKWTDHAEAGYDEWLAIALDKHLDVRCSSVIDWRYFDRAVNDPKAKVLARRPKGENAIQASCILWQRGNDWCSLFTGASWGDGDSEVAVETHQAALDWLGVGQYASPSGLGEETAKRLTGSKIYQKPTPAAARLLFDTIIGGRSELPMGPWSGERAYEIDRRMAYVAESAGELPVGSITWLDPMMLGELSFETANRYPSWLCECTVVIPRPLPAGPFPFRDEETREVSYPTEVGTYERTWLWRQEAEDCLLAGCSVILHRGIGWTRTERALAKWAEWIYGRRMDAPSEAIADYVKKAAVSFIGFLAKDGSGWQVVPRGRGTEMVLAGDRWTGYDAKEVIGDPPGMAHWASWIWMQARRSLYKRQVEEWESGNEVIGSNFDSLILRRPSSLDKSSSLGLWRERCLTNVFLDERRQLWSSEKVTLPGTPREERPKAVEEAKAIFDRKESEWMVAKLEARKARDERRKRGEGTEGPQSPAESVRGRMGLVRPYRGLRQFNGR